MERKIGEVFEYKGKKLKVVECIGNKQLCPGCFFRKVECTLGGNSRITGYCSMREDNKRVVFVEVIDNQKQIEEQLFEKDNVNHPSHYTWLKDLCGIEVIDITRHMDFNIGNSLKYILRSGHKSEQGVSDRKKAIEDLRKAVWYLNDEIKMLEDKQ